MVKKPLSNYCVTWDRQYGPKCDTTVKRLKMFQFVSFKSGDSRDIAQLCQSIVHCRFVDHKKIVEELLCPKTWKQCQKGFLMYFLPEIIFWLKIIYLGTQLWGCLVTEHQPVIFTVWFCKVPLQRKNPVFIRSHCMTNRRALASKKLTYFYYKHFYLFYKINISDFILYNSVS